MLDEKTEVENPEVVKLSEQETLVLELQKERVVSAETSLQLRRTELQLLLDRLVKQAEENGKYKVLGIDTAKGIQRVPN